ncbi:MAG: ABC transporter permease [Microbacterium sp.]|uniref:ABC transporter permease n=1 Tax=Microbacterium sp. TaxID=51671 RepID=UPI0039E5F07D
MTATTVSGKTSPVARSASALRPAYRGGSRRVPLWLVVALGAVVPLVVIVWWWIGAANGAVNTSVFSSPQKVLDTLRELAADGTLGGALAISLTRAGIGLVIGLAVGLFFGIVTGLSRIGGALVDPTAQILRTIPVLAILPLFVAWFGLTELSKYLIIAFAAAAPIYINTSNGINRVDKKLLETAKVFDLSTLQTTFQVVLPAALPAIFNGLRLSVSISILLLVAAENGNSSSGLGYLASQGLQYFRVDLILAIVIVYGILGLLGNLLVSLLERISLPWLGKKGVR